MGKLIMMVGLSGSGKSHYAKTFNGAVIHSSDNIRKELYGDENTQGKPEEVFGILHKRVKKDLKAGRDVVVDACNIDYKKRMHFLKQLDKIDCIKECYMVVTPYEKCLEQNRLRDRIVPEHVIEKMYKNIFVPQYYEGFDKISIIKNFNEKDYMNKELFNRLVLIDQETPYHTMTIGMHCIDCCYKCGTLIRDTELALAALFHDIGKEFVKTYNEEKQHCTYYQHHLVSAYNSIFYLSLMEDKEILRICNLIQWHMQPFFIKSEKAKNKFINLVGQEVYDKVMILHEADKMAH